MLPPPRRHTSPSVVNSQWGGISPLMRSPAIPQPLQVRLDGLLQLRALSELAAQLLNQARHLFGEWLAVILDFLGTDVAARRQHVTVGSDFVGGGGLAEASDVLVLSRPFVPAPCVVGAYDLF